MKFNNLVVLAFFLLIFNIVEGFEVLVRLKKPDTLNKLLASVNEDLSLSTNKKSSAAIAYAKDLQDSLSKIKQKFSFGKFEAFSVDLSKDLISRLKKNPLIADIVFNEKFQAFRDDNNYKYSLNTGTAEKDIDSDNESSITNSDDYSDFDTNYIDDDEKYDNNEEEEEEEGQEDNESGDDEDYDDDDGDDADDDDDEDEDDTEIIQIQNNAPRHLVRLSRREKIPPSRKLTGSDDSKQHISFIKTERGEEEEEEGEEGEEEEEGIEPSKSHYDYYYNSKFQGESVSAYILDTGIKADHPEFENRVIHGADFTREGPGDNNGHGTHVAGIVGSNKYGVAKKVELIEIKVLNKDGQGDLTSVISGLEYAVQHRKNNGDKKLAVANLSLGSLRNSVLNEAVKAAVDSGLIVVVAAGNANTNACWNSPASEPSAITVGAMDDKLDAIAKFSNWGECVDIFASGVQVKSLSHVNDEISVAYSGTSMAAPSVAGLVAILLDKYQSSAGIKEKLIELSTKHFMKRRTLIFKPRTPNRLAFNGIYSEQYDGDSLEKIVELNDNDDSTFNIKSLNFMGSQHDVDVPISDTLILSRRSMWKEPSFMELQQMI
ncbi:Rrt12p SCDLUD_001212 [Saccharomycodes ludwigii]|uniref:Rrt12p n=1 Tax=Saccharomycodes ludwigii TaxID=36035 RepID=UPI001E8221FB|nr:hypothetical protein SCDLUD_001212 [Saccharomycodes ludwigii]KAH3903570.1 hypothetical protein SCDLUD_001212 [Saccharomycodes ludwigii]